MRRLASDILNELEKRVARLEKKYASSVLETLKKLLKVPFGKERYVKDDKKYNYSSNLINEANVISQITENASEWSEGIVKSCMFFNVASVLTKEDVNVRKMKTELEKEVKNLLSKSSLLKDKAREKIDHESDLLFSFTGDEGESRFFDFTYASDLPVKVLVEVKKEKIRKINWVKAKVKIEQDFTFEQKGGYGIDDYGSDDYGSDDW